MRCIFAKCLTIYVRRLCLLNVKSVNLEKTRLNILVTLLGRAMYIWTQVKYRQSPSGRHQYAPNISSSSWVCVTTTTALFTIMQSSQHYCQIYYVKLSMGMDWCTVDSIYCIKNSINYCTCLIVTPIWSPFCARNWCIWSCHWCSSVTAYILQRVPYYYQLHSTAKNWMQQSKSTQCMTVKCWPSFRHAANSAATWSTKRLWYTQTTNLSSTYKCNPSSMPARCVGWILWLTTGWMFAIGQARPTLFRFLVMATMQLPFGATETGQSFYCGQCGCIIGCWPIGQYVGAGVTGAVGHHHCWAQMAGASVWGTNWPFW